MELKELMDKLDVEIKKVEGIISDGLTKQEKGLEGTAQTISQVKDGMVKAEEKLVALETEKKEMEKRLSELEVKGQRPGFGHSDQDKPLLATPGQQFILSDAYQSARDARSNEVKAVDIGSYFERKQIAGATRGDLPPDRAPVWPHREEEYIYEPGQRTIRLFDLMAVSPVTSNSVHYFREVINQNFPGVASQREETATKYQMSINFERETAIIETIAGWLPASRQVLDDAPQLQSYIDGRLKYFVIAEAERQILYGTGVGGQLLGITNTPGIGTIGPPAGAQTSVDIIREAIAQVRVNEYAATAIVLHPNDWAAIELLKGNDLHYIWVQVPNGGEMRLWRVPVIETTVIQQGQFLVGAFGLGAKIWDRQQTTIRVSEHHANFFIQDAVAILAEMRLGLATYRPSAFVLGQLGAIAS